MPCKFKSHLKFPFLNQSAFSLLEILIAIAVAGLAMGLVGFNTSSERDRIKEARENTIRALKFAKSEAAIRNKVVRIKIDMTQKPNAFSIEASDDSQLALPEYVDEEKLDKKEKEVFDKKKEGIDAGFIPIDEFKKASRKLNEDIVISGVATSLSKKLVSEDIAYIYFYPTGFQDAGIILMANYDEVLSIEFESVRDRIMDDYHPLDDFLDSQYEDTVYNKTKEIFDKWSKDNEF